MDKAYSFPLNVDIEKQNISQAIPVTIKTSYHELYQADSHDRLRCIYIHCFEPLNLVHKSASRNLVGHFSHPQSTEKSFCPYRSEWRKPPSTRNPKKWKKYQHNVRKLIESRLYDELLRKLPGSTIRMSDDHDREPRIEIDGLARPLLILSIAPHDEWLWKQPFDGTVEGRQVLFFIAGPDIPELKVNEVNQKLLRMSSAITVYVPGDDEPDFIFKISGELSSTDPASAAPLDQLDLIYVNYQTLFGMNRTPDYLFIKTPQKSPIEFIDRQLESTFPGLTRKLLQLLAKRLVVDSTRVHQIAFEQTYLESRQFFRECNTFPRKNQLIDLQGSLQLQRDSTIEALLKEESLQPVYREFLSQAIEQSIKQLQQQKQTLTKEFEAKRQEMQDTINKLEGEKKNQTTQFEAERTQMQDTINKLEGEKKNQTTRFETERTQLQDTINKLEGEKKNQTTQFETERTKLQGSINKLQESNQSLTLHLRSIKLQLEDQSSQYKEQSHRRHQLEREVDKLENQIADVQKSEIDLRKQLHTKDGELENEKKRTEKLSNALQTLQQNPFSRWLLKHYRIQPN